MKYLNNRQKQGTEVQNSLLELEKDFKELRGRDLRVSKTKKKLRRGEIKKLTEYSITKDTGNPFEQEEDSYKPVRVGDFHSNNQIEYENNGDRNKTLLVREYFDDIKWELKNISNNFNKYDTQKILLIIAINSISSKDNNKEHIMHSKSDNREIMIYEKADEVIK